MSAAETALREPCPSSLHLSLPEGTVPIAQSPPSEVLTKWVDAEFNCVRGQSTSPALGVLTSNSEDAFKEKKQGGLGQRWDNTL